MNTTLIVGLGNPGRKYEQTRHNIGFLVLDTLAERLGRPAWRDERHAQVARVELGGRTALLARPQTFMNNSGIAVRALAQFYRVAPADVLVIADDLDLPYGRVRLRPRGTAGGHNGLRSIIAELGTQEFPRIKIGIGRPTRGEPIDWVLSPFDPEQRRDLDLVRAAAADVVEHALRAGVLAAMNAVNGRADVRAPSASGTMGAGASPPTAWACALPGGGAARRGDGTREMDALAGQRMAAPHEREAAMRREQATTGAGAPSERPGGGMAHQGGAAARRGTELGGRSEQATKAEEARALAGDEAATHPERGLRARLGKAIAARLRHTSRAGMIPATGADGTPALPGEGAPAPGAGAPGHEAHALPGDGTLGREALSRSGESVPAHEASTRPGHSTEGRGDAHG